MPTFTTQIVCELDNYYSLKIEDDGRVAYAYLREGEDVIGDVWLYNVNEAPQTSFWLPEDMPFLNPKEYLSKDANIKPIQQESEIRCELTESKDDGLIEGDFKFVGWSRYLSIHTKQPEEDDRPKREKDFLEDTAVVSVNCEEVL